MLRSNTPSNCGLTGNKCGKGAKAMRFSGGVHAHKCLVHNAPLATSTRTSLQVKLRSCCPQPGSPHLAVLACTGQCVEGQAQVGRPGHIPHPVVVPCQRRLTHPALGPSAPHLRARGEVGNC